MYNYVESLSQSVDISNSTSTNFQYLSPLMEVSKPVTECSNAKKRQNRRILLPHFCQKIPKHILYRPNFYNFNYHSSVYLVVDGLIMQMIFLPQFFLHIIFYFIKLFSIRKSLLTCSIRLHKKPSLVPDNVVSNSYLFLSSVIFHEQDQLSMLIVCVLV